MTTDDPGAAALNVALEAAARAVPSGVDLRSVSPEICLPLRQTVLRPGMPPEAAVFVTDAGPQTLHLGAFLHGRLLSIGSVALDARPGGPDGGFRVRGMATSPEHRGRGLGRAILAGLVAWTEALGASEAWCNARLAAQDLYRLQGFEASSGVFEIPHIGPHLQMVRVSRACGAGSRGARTRRPPERSVFRRRGR